MESENCVSSRRLRVGYLTWGILVGGALLCRAAFVTARLVLTGDEVHYAESLFHFMNGRLLEGISAYWSFLYPLTAVPLGLIYGEAEPGLRLLSMLCGAALVIPSVLVAERLWGRRTALFTGVLVALHPTLIAYSTVAMTEAFYALLLILSLYLFVQHVLDGGWGKLVLAGVLLSLAYQTRQEVQFILAVMVVFVMAGKGKGVVAGSVVTRIARSAVLVAVFVAAAVPYLVALYEKTGRLTPGSKAAVNVSSPYIWEDSLERERYVYSLNEEGTARRIDEVAGENPLALLWRERQVIVSLYFQKFSRGILLLPTLVATPLLMLLVPLGIFGRRWRNGERAAELFLLLAGVFPLTFFPIFRVQIRYLVPFLPFYLLWGARGCEVLIDWMRDNVSRRAAAGSVALLFVFVSLVPYTVNRYLSVQREQHVEYREAGRWIKENEPPGARVLAHSGCPVNYYAGGAEATFMPWTDRDGLIRFAAYHRFTHLLVDGEYVRTFRPTLLGMLDGPAVPGLRLVKRFTGLSGDPILLYRLERQGTFER